MMQGVYQRNGRLMEGTGYNPSDTIVSRGSGYPSEMAVAKTVKTSEIGRHKVYNSYKIYGV